MYAIRSYYDPVVRGRIDSELLLAPEAEPLVLDDARPSSGGEFARRIFAARVDDDDLVGEGEARKTGLELRRGIARDEDGGSYNFV